MAKMQMELAGISGAGTLAIKELLEARILMLALREDLTNRAARGRDGLSWRTYVNVAKADLEQASAKLIKNSYEFTPYRQYLVAKGAGKPPRVISVPSQRDAVVLNQLKVYLHSRLNDAVPKETPNQLIGAIKGELAALSAPNNRLSVARFDIAAYYDSVSLAKLNKKLRERKLEPLALKLIDKALRNETLPVGPRPVEKRKRRRSRGIPQGLSVSNVLASLYLLDIDRHWRIEGRDQGFRYYRYVDDVMLVGPEPLVTSACFEFRKQVKAIGLTVNKEKSSRKPSALADGAEFLGYKLGGRYVSVREASVQRHLNTLVGMMVRHRDFVKHLLRTDHPNMARSIEMAHKRFAYELNERIAGAVAEQKRYGWVAYFIEIDDIALLRRMDRVVREQVARVDAEGWFRAAGATRKKHVRAYYELKHSPHSGYVTDYDSIQDHGAMAVHLARFGYRTEEELQKALPVEIESWFLEVRDRNLRRLSMDLRSIS